MLVFAATVISVFKYYHYYIGVLFIGIILLSFYGSYKKGKEDMHVFWLSVFGFILTLTAGTLIEIWGTSYGYWTYLNLPEHTTIPFWVPFAWGLAYRSLYRLERTLLYHFKFETTIKRWVYCIILPAIILPVIGEAFVIYYETWVYSWQPQIMGVPVLAVVLLGLFHVCVFLIMLKICRIYSINDPVYSKFLHV
jgi:hypothetical protein